MVDPRRASDVNEAAARFADALAESYRIVYGQAAEAQQRQARFAREFSERVLENLREQTESGRAASEALADQARRQQAAGRELAQESVDAYVEFLDTAFSQYRTGTQRAAGSAQEGARAASQTAAGMVGAATGAAAGVVGAATGAAAGTTRAAAEGMAGQPPIAGYDEMNVDEITERLDDLSDAELVRVRDYERRNKNRETLLAQVERRMEASS
jgi:hypothetical protein